MNDGNATLAEATSRPVIRITYCTQCRWLLRAAWLAQELLSTFATDLGEVVLVPGTAVCSRSNAMAFGSGIAPPTAAFPMRRN